MPENINDLDTLEAALLRARAGRHAIKKIEDFFR